MNPETKLDLMELLYNALHSPLGGIIATDDVARLTAKLTDLRAKDPNLSQIEFILSPTSNTELWLVKRPTNGS